MAGSGDQDKASKTEEPTQKRIDEARKEGNFAKAEEIQVVFGLAAAFIVILFYSREMGMVTARVMHGILGGLGNYPLNVTMVVATGREVAGQFLLLVLPVMAASVLASVIAGGLQSGFRLAPKALGVKGSKINPIKGFKQKYGPQALVKFGIDFLKLSAVAGVIVFGLHRVTRHPIFHTRVDIIDIAGFIFETVLYLIVLLMVAMGLIAAIHFLYQKHKTHTDMKMTRQEVKDEHKQQEGDPQVKSARRQMARQLAQRQMFASIPEADVVITNPTHYAVALRYNRAVDPAPVVIAKGRNLIAQRIKQIAAEHGVPMVENRPAAQALFKIGQVGMPIPPDMYKVVAEVLAYVYKAHRRFFAKRGVRF